MAQDSTKAAKQITLLFACDDKFAMPMTVAAHSALRHMRRDVDIDIYVADGGITQANRAKATTILQRAHPRTRLHFETCDLSAYTDCDRKRLTLSALSRIFVAQIVPPETERVLYLDSDLVVTDDISALWAIDLGDAPVGAVRDSVPKSYATLFDLQIPGVNVAPGTPYFNSGVMLFNLPVWKSQGFEAKTTAWLDSHGGTFLLPDQDALNVALIDAWCPLDPSWNNQMHWPAMPPATKGITHYTLAKPWQNHFDNKMAMLFFGAYLRSGWDPPIKALSFVGKRVSAQLYWRLARGIAAIQTDTSSGFGHQISKLLRAMVRRQIRGWQRIFRAFGLRRR
ncbi:MAG: glycosyltransferase family 8 protein [Pseudomonadota bacterium]